MLNFCAPAVKHGRSYRSESENLCVILVCSGRVSLLIQFQVLVFMLLKCLPIAVEAVILRVQSPQEFVESFQYVAEASEAFVVARRTFL